VRPAGRRVCRGTGVAGGVEETSSCIVCSLAAVRSCSSGAENLAAQRQCPPPVDAVALGRPLRMGTPCIIHAVVCAFARTRM
jgi:hypothetical protein